jgi:3-hydroxyisobutyrate dehydrogenase
MLVDAEAADAVLERGAPGFADRVKGRTIVQMGSTPPVYSKALEIDLRCAGANYVEAPVSGSRRPAEAGQLVAMLAGEEETIARIRPLLAPMCRETVVCGSAPNALLMKLAVNIFLMAVVTGLAESVHFADRNGLDLTQLAAILNAGQLASDISRVKIPKLVGRDFAVQAAVPDALEANRLVAETARAAGIATPILDVCHALYGETLAMGLGEYDMVAVLRAIEARSDSIALDRS